METINHNKLNTYPRYLKYKDSGIDWIGEIPEGWEVTAVKHLLEIPITDGPHTTPELIDDGIPFISAEAIKNNQIDFSKKRGYISLEDYLLFSKKYKPEIQDIYMVKSGATTGSIAMVLTNDIFTIWSPLAVFRCNKNKLLPYFLFYFLQSNSFQKGIELHWSYGTQQNIGMGILGNLPVNFPPLAEQQQIADFLDSKTALIDEAISLKQQQIDKLKEYKQITIQTAVTRGLSPNAPMKNSGIDWIGEIPEHWEVKKIKYCLKLSSNKIESKLSDKVYLGMESIESQTGKLSGISSDVEGLANLFEKDDILFGKLRPYLAKVYLTEWSGICSTEFLVFKIGSNFSKKFILNLFLSNSFIKIVDASTYGSKMPRANPEFILNLYIPIPPLAEQQQIANYLAQKSAEIDATIAHYEQQIDKLKEYKTVLIQAAVTGQIKVSNDG